MRDRRRRRRHRRPVRRLAARAHARRHAVRGRGLRGRPHGHGRRRARRPALGDRHRLHRLQRLDLPELHRAAAATRRRVAAVEHELQPALRAHRARVQRHLAQLAVRAAPQPRAAVVPAHDRRHPALQRARQGWLARETEADVTLGEFLRAGGYSRQFVEHYIVPMGRAIWSAEASAMLGFPARFFVDFFDRHGFLNVDDRPGLADRHGRLARVRARACSRQLRGTRAALDAGRSRSAAAEPGAAAHARAATSSVRPRVPRLPYRPGAGAARAPTPAERERARRAARTRRTKRCCTPTRRVLPRRQLARAAWNYHLLREAAGAGRADLRHERAAGPARRPRAFLVTLNHRAPSTRATSCARSSTRIRCTRPRACAAQAPASRAQRRPAHLLLRRLLALRLPRGRRRQRARPRWSTSQRTWTVHSCLYHGSVRHRRHEPAGTRSATGSC